MFFKSVHIISFDNFWLSFCLRYLNKFGSFRTKSFDYFIEMSHASILSNSEKLLSLESNYLTWKELWLLYISEQSDKSLKGAQEVILETQKLKQALIQNNLWDHVSSLYTERITAIQCFFGIFSSLWASRIWESTGTSDPVWNIMMQEVETQMSKIQSFMKQDHVLHLKLCELYVKIKFLNTNIYPENLTKVDEYYKEAARWRVNCGESFNCVYSGCLIDNMCMEVAWRANNWKKSAMLGLKVRESLTADPHIKNDKASKIVLGFLNCHYMEKSRLLRNEVDELNYTTEGLQLLKSIFTKTPTSHICRPYRNLAAKSLIDKSVKADVSEKRARRYLDRANSVWKKLINLSKNNVNHPRYQSCHAFNFLELWHWKVSGYSEKLFWKFPFKNREICTSSCPHTLSSLAWWTRRFSSYAK